jgi:hypothetical protein
MVQLTESQKARRKRMIDLATEALTAAGAEVPNEWNVAYSALPTLVVMSIERVKADLDPELHASLVERFDAIVAEEHAERSS